MRKSIATLTTLLAAWLLALASVQAQSEPAAPRDELKQALNPDISP